VCGVIGIVSKNIIPKDIIKTLIVQSKIRGKHATGISYLENENIKTKIIPKEATFMDFSDVNTKCLIGHARYSTSSLEHNQPISYKDISIVHNGVITQEESKNWDNNYDFQTENDSEFILKSFIENKHPIKEYENASISSIIINNKEQEVSFFRNEKRPLYYSEEKDMYVIASTKNILIRSNFININKCDCCVNYTIKNNKLSKYKIRDINVDLQ
tara:strand:+ start:156 stop:800 length:645 start_codon:yes stop_codon:yes gene_type:complete